MRKRIFTTILFALTVITLCVTVIPQPAAAAEPSVYVAGYGLSANTYYKIDNTGGSSQIIAADKNDYQVYFDSNTGTLTLKNAEIINTYKHSSSINATIYIKSDVWCINLIGNNQIYNSITRDVCFAIWSECGLTINASDGARLTANAVGSPFQNYGIYVMNGLTVNGGEIYAGGKANTNESSAGIYGIAVIGDILINGGTVNATAEGTAHFADDTAESIGISCRNLSVTGGSLTALSASPGTESDNSYGILAWDSVRISGGSVSARGYGAGDGIGVYVNSSYIGSCVDLSGSGSLEAIGGGGAVIRKAAGDPLAFDGEYIADYKSDASASAFYSQYGDYVYDSGHEYIKIQHYELLYFINGALRLSDDPAGKEYKGRDDTWTADGNALSLINFSYTTNSSTALVLTADTVLYLTGVNSLTSTRDKAYVTSGIDCKGYDLTVHGNGTLNVTGGNIVSMQTWNNDNDAKSYGIRAAGCLTIQDGVTVNAKGGSVERRYLGTGSHGTAQSTGIEVSEKLTVESYATVNAVSQNVTVYNGRAESYGIRHTHEPDGSSMDVNNATLTAVSGTVSSNVADSTASAALSIGDKGENLTPYFSGCVVTASLATAGTDPVSCDWTLLDSYKYLKFTPKVATPTLSLKTGTHVGTQSVTISCTTPGVTYRYTTDGSEPTATSPTCTEYTVTKSMTLKVKAFRDGMAASDTASETYTIEPCIYSYTLSPGDTDFGGRTLGSPLQFDAREYTVTNNGNMPITMVPPVTGPTYTVSTTDDWTKPLEAGKSYKFKIAPKLRSETGRYTSTVTLNTDYGVSTRFDLIYTINPALSVNITGDSEIYSDEDTVLTAYVTGGTGDYSYQWGTLPGTAGLGTSSSLNVSPDATVTYELIVMDECGATMTKNFEVKVSTRPVVATPVLSPAGGIYPGAQSVTITCATAGATVRYTTDGSEPTAASAEYKGAISVTASTTIKARAFMTEMTDSATAVAEYKIKPAVELTAGSASFPEGGAAQDASFTVGAGIEGSVKSKNYLKTTLNGADVTQVTAADGSVILTFPKDYLNTLKEGTHEYSVVLTGAGYEGVTVSVTLTVTEKRGSPDTGDTLPAEAGLWLAVAAAALAIPAALTVKTKKRRG